MPTLNFKREFEPLILSGAKTQTIRAPRRGRQIQVGDKLILTVGKRTSSYYRQLLVVTCDEVCLIRFRRLGASGGTCQIYDAGNVLRECNLREMARLDGFSSPQDLIDFFLPATGDRQEWKGYLIVWRRAPGLASHPPDDPSQGQIGRRTTKRKHHEH